MAQSDVHVGVNINREQLCMRQREGLCALNHPDTTQGLMGPLDSYVSGRFRC